MVEKDPIISASELVNTFANNEIKLDALGQLIRNPTGITAYDRGFASISHLWRDIAKNLVIRYQIPPQQANTEVDEFAQLVGDLDYRNLEFSEQVIALLRGPHGQILRDRMVSQLAGKGTDIQRAVQVIAWYLDDSRYATDCLDSREWDPILAAYAAEWNQIPDRMEIETSLIEAGVFSRLPWVTATGNHHDCLLVSAAVTPPYAEQLHTVVENPALTKD